ncbi:MAG: hypothetical protein Q4D51_03645 [Eubacteriales bacterium]|nr:hypothetical protein [Eubacteriales bacterium]
MKYEMSERDKKLLIMLSVFVIVVGIGYWGIFPQIKSIREMDEQLKKEKQIQQKTELKLAELPMLLADVEDMEQSILDARKNYYQMMTSNEVDRYFTNMVLDYGLYSYDLDIGMPHETTKLEPYQFSAKALGMVEEPEEVEVEEKSALEKVDEAAGIEADDEEDAEALFEEEEVDNGIYAVHVSMRLGGEMDRLKKLVDDLSNTDDKLRVCSYSYSQITDSRQNENGEMEIVGKNILQLTLEIYMCEE